MKKIAIIGGGAAGFMAAVTLAKLHPDYNITIFEQGKEVLQKVKISGGGRCNVTHHCFDVAQLITNYPRGSKELQSVFYKFNPQNTIDFFESNGVKLKTESDGRMFPITDNSQTIINCFLNLAATFCIDIKTQTKINDFVFANNKWLISLNNSTIEVNHIVLATGSSPSVWNILKKLGHTIITPVPSLFTFQIKHPLLVDMPGTTFAGAQLNLINDKISTEGPVLITHWGLSGPAVLKLSAFKARQLFDAGYNTILLVNFTGLKKEKMMEQLLFIKQSSPNKKVENAPQFNLTNRFWKHVLTYLQINSEQLWSEIKNEKLDKISSTLARCEMQISGKGIFKEEFVTAGGVDLKQIDFKTMQSKVVPNLSMAGEVLNIDGITGGFNFQAAWSCGYLAGFSIN
jgi:predicted Rossmann fold flavoprotein